MADEINQTGNTVFGDQAGRDINKLYLPKKGPLREIAEKITVMYESDETFQGFIDELLHFTEQHEKERKEFKGLEVKLTEAGYREDLNEALILKEKFSKKIFQNQFSEQVQNLYVKILAHINTVFKMKVLPLIRAGKEEVVIKDEIFISIINPIHEQLAPTSINITMDEVRGMLYFLTGNCHIEWV